MTRRTNAGLAGFLFLLYIAVGVTQMVLGSSTRADTIDARLALFAQHAVPVRINVLLSLLICVIAMTLGVTLYAITRDEDRDLAVLALSCRIGEGLLAAIGPIATLGLLWLAAPGAHAHDAPGSNALAGFLLQTRGWVTAIAATLFAVGSTLFSWLMLRGRLIPAPLAWLGVIASVLLVVGLPLGLVGFVPDSLIQILWLPMAAFEIPLAVWLMIKGVPAPAMR